MPLRDHFRPPLDDRHSWDEIHGQWPAMIVLQLFDLLPAGYEAAPKVHLGSFCEIDIATFEGEDAGARQRQHLDTAEQPSQRRRSRRWRSRPICRRRTNMKCAFTTCGAVAAW
jgi:hypothetical protein